jgi:Fe-S cluster assembly scaffold protein SufB
MSVFIEWSGAEGSLLILWLAQSGSNITLDWVGKAAPWCQDVKLRIDQTNILLGNNAKVKGRPVLEVATDSIEWGHSCRIHRISWEALFYLESHGIDSQTAEGMLLEAEIHRCTDLLEERGDEVKGEVLEKLWLEK